MGDWSKYSTHGCLFESSPGPAPTLQAPANSNLPRRVDLRGHCPPIEDQRATNSCVANAIVGALEIHQRKAGLPVTDLSRLFLYYNARALDKKEEADTGSLIHKGMAAVMAFGVCEERMWPFVEAMIPTRPTEGCYKNATSYEAIQFARTERGQPALAALAQGLPVAFGMYVPKKCYDAAAETGVMQMPDELPGPNQPSGHAMLLVGYDLDKEAYLVRNSWGPGYGDGGYLWIPFKVMDATSPAEQFWTIGAIEQAPGMSLLGPTILESVESVTSQVEGPSPLDGLRGELRERLNRKLDSARADFRNRLRGGR